MEVTAKAQLAARVGNVTWHAATSGNMMAASDTR